MKHWILWSVVLSCAAGGAVGAYGMHRRAVRAEILQSYSAVVTVEDYADNPGYVDADLAARQKLDALNAEGLAEKDQRTVDCVANLLRAVESLNSSHTIETTDLRLPIAEDAARKAEACINRIR